MSTKPWYLTGPMSNIPGFNFPAFDDAAARLRAIGYDLIVPSEQDSPEMQAKARASPDGNMATLTSAMTNHETWGDVLSRDVKLVADRVDGLILMDGWQTSRGAKLEVFVALLTGKRFKRFYSGYSADSSGQNPEDWSADTIRYILKDSMP